MSLRGLVRFVRLKWNDSLPDVEKVLSSQFVQFKSDDSLSDVEKV